MTMFETQEQTQVISLMLPVQEAISGAKTVFEAGGCNCVQAGQCLVATRKNTQAPDVYFEVSFESLGLNSCELRLKISTAKSVRSELNPRQAM
jgi:hypothetical protein